MSAVKGVAPMLAALKNGGQNGGDVRLFLMHGNDESVAEDAARQLAKAMGGGAERVDIDSSELKNDPARLLDEAASMSLFGDKRYIRLRITRDDALPALENLLSAVAAGNPVIATAGNLTKANKIRKLAESSPRAMAMGCYPPDEKDVVARIIDRAREQGLKLDRVLARQIYAATHGDVFLAEMEVEKLVLYTDAAPDRPRDADPSMLAALGAETAEEDMNALLHAVLAGDSGKLGAELRRAAYLNLNAVRIVKALERRTNQLLSLRARLGNGGNARGAVESDRSIFWKEQDAYVRELSLWTAPRLTRLNQRLIGLEGAIMANHSMADTLLGHELSAICQAAATAGRR
jgi:DNA polymerase III subunit delta